MSTETSTGHLGSLTPEEEQKLQQAWLHLLRLSGLFSSTDSQSDNNQPDETTTTQNFRQALWNLFLGDHPDVMVLRFLRARKWDTEKSMAMLTDNLHWRHQHRVDEDVVRRGDSTALSPPGSLVKHDKEFLAQYHSGKAYVRGSDKWGRPIFLIKVRLHDPKLQSAEALEAFVLHSIETIRMMMRAPLEKACLLFDLTGFGLKNMDFHIVKFLAQTFEARYPEYLGVVLVHNAPFVFNGIWRIIKPWLDPVIAAKINFTSGTKGLLEFITKENLQKSYGGQDNWEYNYVPPSEGENTRMKSEKKDEVQADRDDLVKQFERETLEWAGMDLGSEQGKQKSADRTALAEKLAESFWRLDPYVRARTYYHRVGVVDERGKVDFRGAK